MAKLRRVIFAAKGLPNIGKYRFRVVRLCFECCCALLACRPGRLEEGQIGVSHVTGCLVTRTGALILVFSKKLVGKGTRLLSTRSRASGWLGSQPHKLHLPIPRPSSATPQPHSLLQGMQLSQRVSSRVTSLELGEEFKRGLIWALLKDTAPSLSSDL